MDKGEAYRTLDLDEEASRNHIESRFVNLSRRIKNGEELDLEKIKEAYELLMGMEKYERNNSWLARAYRKFMFHYRGWAFLILVSVTIMAIVLVPIFFRRIPDLTVSFAGRYAYIDQDIMDEVLQEKMPDTEDILVEVMYLDEDGESAEFDSGGRTRLTGLLISEEADILIVDDETYNYIRSDDALMSLDDLLIGMSVDLPEDRLIYGVDFETGDKKVFGIKADESYLVYRTVYGATERIITVAKKSGHIEEVKKAIEILLSYRSE